MAISGALREGPGLSEVATTPSTYVSSVAVDKSGMAYVCGNGVAGGGVSDWAPDGQGVHLFETKDVSVCRWCGVGRRAVCGYCAKREVYRLKPARYGQQDEGGAEVVFDRANWTSQRLATARRHLVQEQGSAGEAGCRRIALHLGDDVRCGGAAVSAAGGPGAVYRVDASKKDQKPEVSRATRRMCVRWRGTGRAI